MSYPADKTTLEIQQINFQGNIIPASWKNHFRLKSGLIDLNAMWVLSEIVYWYRPTCLRDENGNEVYSKKYKSDLLQKSYSDLAASLGLNKRQVQDSVIRLEEKGLIKRHLRTILAPIPGGTDTRPISNILFIEIFPEKIKEITYSSLKKFVPYPVITGEGSSLNVGGETSKRGTYTGTTPETTLTEIKGIDSDVETLPLKKEKGVIEKGKSKYPLKKEQQPYFEKMKGLDLGSDDETLMIIIRDCFKKDKVVLLEKAISHIQEERKKGTKLRKPAIALFRSVLNGKISPISENAKTNKKFAETTKTKFNWQTLTIKDKFIICEKSHKEIHLDQDAKDFKEQLKYLYELNKAY